MDNQDSTEKVIVPALAVAMALVLWGSLHLTCALAVKVGPQHSPVIVAFKG